MLQVKHLLADKGSRAAQAGGGPSRPVLSHVQAPFQNAAPPVPRMGSALNRLLAASMRVAQARDDGRADLVDVLLHRLTGRLRVAGREGIEDGEVLAHHVPAT